MESMLEYVEVKFALDYSKEDDILYDDMAWSRKDLERRILALIEKMQNALLVKNKLNIVEGKLANLITKGNRKNLCKNEMISSNMSAMVNTLTARSGGSRNNY